MIENDFMTLNTLILDKAKLACKLLGLPYSILHATLVMTIADSQTTKVFMFGDGAFAYKTKSNDINPFSALFSFMKKSQKPKKDEKDKLSELKINGIPKEKYAEKYVRSLAEAKAINSCYVIYDIYKKSHRMPSLPYVEDEEAEAPDSFADKLFGFT